jgi:endonuclease/exonuclease/phosphatase (EEP) superfamily protein YafD
VSSALQVGLLGGGIVLLLVSMAAAPLATWWIANVITNFRLQLAASGLLLLVLGLLLRMPCVALIATAAVVFNGLLVLERLRPAAAAVGLPATGPVLRLMSLNLLYTSRHAEAVFRQVDRIQPDVLLLQEVGTFWAGAVSALRASFPHRVELPRVSSWPHAHGVLLLSRHPILEADQQTLGGPSIRLAAARLAIGDHALWVASVHAAKPNGRARLALQQSQLEQLAAWVDARAGPVLLGGDLNATPYAPQLGRLLAATGMTLDQQVSPAQAFTSTFPAALPVLGLKLDHILVRGMTIRRAWTLPPAGSDHRAVVADVALPE